VIGFRILGPLDAVDGDRVLALGGPRQQALLAMLLVHRGESVSSDRLIDGLWEDRAPPTAIKIVQGYVSGLRKVLGDGLLVTVGRGYALQTEPGQVDADRFEALVGEGRRALRDGDTPAAAARLRQALALWRGPALADFAYDAFAQPEIARLEEARLAALGDRIDADLALGEHAGVVAELERLIHEHPLRERFVAQLMLAQYRSGRQADALAEYRAARGRLVAELGLEPGRELQKLERAILAQDPELEPAAPSLRPTEPPQPPPAQPRRPRQRSGVAIAAGAIVLLAVLVAAALRLAGSGTATVTVAPNSLAAIDVRTNLIVGAAPVGARPGAVAWGAGSLWVANLDDQTISRIDPRTLGTPATIRVTGPPTAIATTAGRVWVVEAHQPGLLASTSSVTAARIDPTFDAIAQSVRIGNVDPSGPGAAAAVGDAVWVAPSTGLLTQLNAATGDMVHQVDPNATPGGIAVGGGAVWLTDTEADNVVRIDPTGLLSAIDVGNGPTGITVGGGGVWVADSLDDSVVRIDLVTRSVTATIPVGRAPASVAYGAGSVWVANSGDGTVTRIDARSGRVLATIPVGGSPQAIAIADGRAWVTVDARAIAPAGRGSGGGTVRMVTPRDIDYMDPALAYTVLSQQLLYATCAKLVNYPDRPPPGGSNVTAEVAAALPKPTAGGTTYTFTIRPGFRFSPPLNEPVTAQTFKFSIERTLDPKMHSPIAQYLADIVGARAYMAGRAGTITGLVAAGDTLTIHLLHPVPDFLVRLAQPAFCAVPPDTPINPDGVRVIPSAGPYYVSSYIPKQGVVLTRNPNYHGSRPHHFAKIELAVGVSTQRSATEIEAGTADYTPFGVSSSTAITALVSQLVHRFGSGSAAAARGDQRYFVYPTAQLDYFYLNSHRPLFADVRMRQAVNFAIDRRRIGAYGDAYNPLPDRPATHYLSPEVPGFRDVRVYPLSPDVAKARALAGSGRRTAVLYTCDAYPCPEQAQIVTTDLARIGIRVEVRELPLTTLFARETTPGEPFDLGWQGWLPDYPDPEAMLDPLLEEPAYGPTFDDPVWQRKLAAAARLSGPARYLSYGALDLDLAREAAPLAAIGNLDSAEFFSARIGCEVYGVYDIDLAALCLRHG
jgi:YVTN family beta-propeller protein